MCWNKVAAILVQLQPLSRHVWATGISLLVAAYVNGQEAEQD